MAPLTCQEWLSWTLWDLLRSRELGVVHKQSGSKCHLYISAQNGHIWDTMRFRVIGPLSRLICTKFAISWGHSLVTAWSLVRPGSHQTGPQAGKATPAGSTIVSQGSYHHIMHQTSWVAFPTAPGSATSPAPVPREPLRFNRNGYDQFEFQFKRFGEVISGTI